MKISRWIGVTALACNIMIFGKVCYDYQVSLKTESISMSSEAGKNDSYKLGSDLFKEAVLMNDSSVYKNWGVQNIDSQKAWLTTQGSKDVVVAIIDTGIDIYHEDLKDNLWVNTGEIPDNGIDDDNNGYIDDVYGWNFVSNNNDLTDNHGHGTHIAGIIGAVKDNTVGISGVAPKVSLMVLKYFDPQKPVTDNVKLLVQAIDYAVKMNVHIINYSGGGLQKSLEEELAIQRAANKNILFVAAAGNEENNSDIKGFYPADYNIKNILSVAALNKSDRILSTSNYGKNSVDLAAPGEKIYSTLPGNNYGYMSGTSQATAFVSGVAVLLMAQNNQLKNPVILKQYLTQTGDRIASLKDKTKYQVKLNSYRALTMKSQNMFGEGRDEYEIEGLKALRQEIFTISGVIHER